MTQNDIIQMARKAGMSGLSLIDIGYLERFHALSIAAAKEEMLMAGNDQRLEEARAAEREEERGVFKTRPLTDEQIDAMWQQSCREHFSGLQREIHLARAIEHAHGIK